MKKTDARVRYTQKVLKESLLKFLKEKPINKITVKEVCDLAELNRATFYSHYNDCFALLDSIETELVEAFGQSLVHEKSFSVTSMIEAFYGIIENNREACSVLIIGHPGSPVLQRMIALARDNSIDCWRKELPKATEADLDLLYTHLSNGLLHVFVEGCDKYDKETIIEFVNRMVKSSLTLFR